MMESQDVDKNLINNIDYGSMDRPNEKDKDAMANRATPDTKSKPPSEDDDLMKLDAPPDAKITTDDRIQSDFLYDTTDEPQYEKDARVRSRLNGVYRFFYAIATSVTFNFFIFCLILLNSFTLAIHTYDESEE